VDSRATDILPKSAIPSSFTGLSSRAEQFSSLNILYCLGFSIRRLTVTSLPEVIWEEGRVAALLHTYTVKFALVTMAHPKFAPQSTPSRGPIPKPHYLPASSLDPSDLRCETASGSDAPFLHNALDRPTDRRTYVRTDQQIVHGKI